MTVQEINNERNTNGIFSSSNDSCGWYAVSRDGIHMITFYQGKWNFTQNDDVNKFYKTEQSFATRLTQLLNRGY